MPRETRLPLPSFPFHVFDALVSLLRRIADVKADLHHDRCFPKAFLEEQGDHPYGGCSSRSSLLPGWSCSSPASFIQTSFTCEAT